MDICHAARRSAFETPLVARSTNQISQCGCTFRPQAPIKGLILLCSNFEIPLPRPSASAASERFDTSIATGTTKTRSNSWTKMQGVAIKIKGLQLNE